MNAPLEIVIPKRKKYLFPFILIITLSSFCFFKPAFFGDTPRTINIYDGIFLLFLLIAAPSIVRFFLKKSNHLFTLPIELIGISIAITYLVDYLFWSQGIVDSFLGALLPVTGYLFYFYLLHEKVNFKIIEKVIITIGILFIFFFLISFAIYPDKIFNFNEFTDRSILRIFLFGDGLLFLFYFLCLNKFVSTKKIIWLIFVLAAYTCIILNQTRVYMISTTVISLIYLLSFGKTYVKIGTVALVIAMLIYLPQQKFIQKLQDKTTSDVGNNASNYIRVQSANYYLERFQPSIVTEIFGNGFQNGSSYYAREYQRVTSLGFYAEDLGFLGLYIRLGLIAIVAYVIIFLRAIKAKLKPEFVYLKMFIFFMLFNGITTSATFNMSYTFAIVFTLYLYDYGRRDTAEVLITT